MTTSNTKGSRWVLVPRPISAARVRLVCLPHAGGGASAYFAWGAALQPNGIEVRAVQYPGRESRFAEPAITDAHTMAIAMAERWEEIAGPGPCALYGHSMGALLAFSLVVELERRGANAALRRLFVSGHQAPHLPYRAPPVHDLPDEAFLPAVSSYFGGIPEGLMREPEIAALISAPLRSDFTLVENYAWREAGPLAVPITALGGTEDRWTTVEEVMAWEQHTRAGFCSRMIPGDHFFPVSNRTQVLAQLVDGLR